MIELLQGDAFRIPLDDGSVHCVITSPPYWGLRSYSGDQARVWGGDVECSHEWETEEIETGSAVYGGKERWQHHGYCILRRQRSR